MKVLRIYLEELLFDNGYERVIASMVINFLMKTHQVVLIKVKICENHQLAEELHNPIIRKFEKRKVNPSFKDHIWVADLACM